MPLVVPGINSQLNKDDEWLNKLVGKKITEEPTTETTFCKRDLPEACRVVKPGQMMTMDFNPDRLNVHLKEDGTVNHVTHG